MIASGHAYRAASGISQQRRRALDVSRFAGYLATLGIGVTRPGESQRARQSPRHRVMISVCGLVRVRLG
jgi:hypothetical protein